jgi:hypothetical protein
MKNRKGQSTFELSLTIVVVIAAVIAMAIFMKRSVMGKLRDSGDQVGGQFTPLSTVNDYTRTYTGQRTTTTGFTGTAAAVIDTAETQNKTGTESVQAPLTAETLF